MTLLLEQSEPPLRGEGPRRPLAVAEEGRAPRDTVDALDLAHRVGWSAAGLAVLASTVRLYPIGGSFGAAPALLAPATLLVFVALALVWRGGAAARLAASWLLLVLGTVASVVWSIGTWLASPSYGTDAVAFNEQATDLLLAGRNPYGVDLSASFDAYGVPPTLATLTLDGSLVTEFSYPAGSLLPLAAAKALGLGAQAANVVDLVSWVAALWLLFLLLPRSLRWVAVLLLTDNLLGGTVTGGVTDPMYLVPLMLALWRWDRYGAGAGVASWVGPVALGLACSVKQLPWFFAPFLLVGVCMEARRRGERWVLTGARYTGVALTVFLVVNGPFIVDDPVAWSRGAFLPLVQPLVPDGQGLVSLIVQMGLGGGNLAAVSVAGYAGYGALLLLVVSDYERWRRGWPLLVVAAFLLPSRSLSTYLLMALPAVFVALTSVGGARDGALGRMPAAARRATTVAAALLATLAAGAAATALATPSPLDISVVDVRTTGARQTLSEVTVEVTNRSADPVTPSWTVTSAGRHSGWWQPAQPVTRLAPQETRTVVLSAPGTTAMPGSRGRFQVTAFAAGPPTVSTSERRQRTTTFLTLSPSVVPDAVPVGEALVVTVQARDRLGVPLERAGIPVALSQVVFAPEGVLPGTVSIDGEAPGRSPVTSVTRADGSAEFTVEGTAALRDPVYLQAWIAADAADPQSFSNYVSLRFLPPAQEGSR